MSPVERRHARVVADPESVDVAAHRGRERLPDHREVAAGARLDAREVEQFRHDAGDLVAVTAHGVEDLAALHGRRIALLQEFGVTGDDGDRRAQFVRGGRHEAALGAVQLVGSRDVAEVRDLRAAAAPTTRHSSTAGRGRCRRRSDATPGCGSPADPSSPSRAQNAARERPISPSRDQPVSARKAGLVSVTQPAASKETRPSGDRLRIVDSSSLRSVRRDSASSRARLESPSSRPSCRSSPTVWRNSVTPNCGDGLLVLADRDAMRHALDLRQRLRDPMAQRRARAGRGR